MNTLNPGARWLYRWYGLCMFLPILIFIFIFSLAGIPASAQGGLIFLLVGAVSGFIALIFILIIIEIYARMSYNRFLYEITNEGIKIEHVVIITQVIICTHLVGGQFCEFQPFYLLNLLHK